MSKLSIDKISNHMREIGEVIEDEFSNWNSAECMPFQTLFQALCTKLNWSEDDFKKNDPFVRWYVHKHDEWTSVRGVKGGCQRLSLVNARKAAVAAKDAIKAEVMAKIDLAIAASNKEKIDE